MDYYKLFNLEKEPFSNTPDPDFFFRSTRHTECLQKLEIAIRLHRGLCIVRGEVGTGKTTLCRQLVRTLSDDETISVHMVLDPGYEQSADFARAINAMLAGRQKADHCATTADHKESIKQHLFAAGVDQGKTTVLIIDEGQKLPAGCIEFLRELLNYETNRDKLLQIVIFAQDEIRDLLAAHPNFADRAALCHHLKPLNRRETVKLIEYRLRVAGSRHPQASAPRFTRRGISRIYRFSRGYPRRIVHLGHHILLLLLVRGQNRVTPAVVRRAAASLPDMQKAHQPWGAGYKTAAVSAAAALLAIVGIAAYAQWPLNPDPEPNAGAAALPNQAPAKPDSAPGKISATLTAAAGIGLPSSLGRVRINRDEKLWHMLRRIYGKGSDRMLKEIKAANPGLRDPDRIRPGQKIRFPVIQSRPVPENQHYWLTWKESADLNRVYQFVFDRPEAGLRVLSFWHPEYGLRHAAVGRKSFSRQADARQALARQDKALAAQGEILDLSEDRMYLLTSTVSD